MILGAVEASDGGALHTIFIEPGVPQYLFDGTAPSRADTQGHVEAAITHPAWKIVVEGAVAGLVSLRPVGGADHEPIIMIGSRCWGQGLARRASQEGDAARLQGPEAAAGGVLAARNSWLFSDSPSDSDSARADR